MPKVSLVTPMYNAARFIERTVRSVQAQTWPDWEQIVVDDGSQDDGATLVERLAEAEPRLKLIRQPNGGVAQARNRGYREIAADSRYVLFLDADDCLEPAMLETLVAYLEARPEVGMVHCGHSLIDEADRPLDPGQNAFARPRYLPTKWGLRELRPDEAQTPFISILCLAWLVPSVVLLRRSVYAATPGWDEKLGHVYEDTDLFLQMALRSQVHFLAARLVRYRRHPGQSTADPEHVSRQESKLLAKWRSGVGLSEGQKLLVRQAWRQRQGRVMPILGFGWSRAYLARGQFLTFGRFGLGGLRNYLLYFLPWAWKTPR